MASSCLHDVCSTGLCLLTCMISSYPYDVLFYCKMSFYLYDIFHHVWCLPTCMLIEPEKFSVFPVSSNLRQPSSPTHPFPLLLIVILNAILHFFCLVKETKFGITTVRFAFFLFCQVFFVKNIIPYSSLPPMFSVSRIIRNESLQVCCFLN